METNNFYLKIGGIMNYKKLIIFIIIVVITILPSCKEKDIDNNNIIENETTKKTTEKVKINETLNSNETSNPNETSHYSETFIGEKFDLEVFEILLPEDGETVIYSPSIIFYENDKNEKLEVSSCTKNGNKLIFTTNETEYWFDPLGICILSTTGEVFVGLNGIKQNDGTYHHETIVLDPDYHQVTIDLTKKEIKDYFKENYNEDLSYFYYNHFIYIYYN